ncbi:carboxylesterase family protein [Marinilabilia rubra]|uniref:Phospholipase n=1 Tax=Marinilabilia rubra TaxID=2162893 RepID=A0A2U2B5Z7_9BACT|nr:dienelactone hydrolase family protein [Marinilabilia rubra]PWD98500.1 phospholipase [Marinilabilia rubra]
MSLKKLLFSFLLAASTFMATNAQYYQPGPQVETFYSEIDDSEQPYALYLPEDFDPDKIYPLLVMLHGAMSNHRLALKRVFGKTNLPGESDAEASRYFPEWDNVQYIVVAPYARGTMGYVGIPEDDVIQVIDKCRKDFNIDRNRIYLTGLSMGGGGTLFMGMAYADLFAAIAPVCPAPPDEYFDIAENALNIPVSVHQGGADPVVRPEGTRRIVDELRNIGTMVEYHEYPGVHHDSWANAYENEKIFEWFDGIERDPFPARVRYATKWYKNPKAYWVKIDKLTPGMLARIDAEFTGSNAVVVKTDNLDAFSLNLKGHPRFDTSNLLSVTIDGKEINSLPKYNHSFVRKEGKWETGKYHAPVVAKKQGLEGPMYEVVTDRHVFVYGTQNDSGKEEINQRKEIAKEAADFSVSFGGFFEQNSEVNPRVIADQQVSRDDLLHSNLVLFGTSETNSVIADMADELPLQLEAKGDSLGLAYCYPYNGNLVVVSSGLPFWTFVPDENGRETDQVIRFGGATGAQALKGMKDYILFRKSNHNVLVEGIFDNDWKLPVDVIEKLESNGVVVRE